MKKLLQKIKVPLLSGFLLLLTLLVNGQENRAGNNADTNSKVFSDTVLSIVSDSLRHDLGEIPMNNNKLTKYFKYIGKVPSTITRTWTGDPHFICDYPHEPLIPGKIYSLTICFWNEGRTGFFETVMGFDLSNGEHISFQFRGTVLPRDQAIR